MKKFITKIILFVSVLIGCSAIIWRLFVLKENEYSKYSHETNIIKQINRLDTLHSPKIVIIGGSNCGFGISSSMLHEHFKMNVSNTGTHAGLGLRLQIELFKEYITEGDIVIVIPEYEQYVSSFLGDAAALRILTSIYPEGYKKLSALQQLHLFSICPGGFRNCMQKQWSFPLRSLFSVCKRGS